MSAYRVTVRQADLPARVMYAIATTSGQLGVRVAAHFYAQAAAISIHPIKRSPA